MKANPEGSPNLAKGPGHYCPTAANWRNTLRRQVTWYPALALCKGSIADLGCGPGTFGRMALDCGHDYRFGMDFSPVAVEVAREQCPEAHFAQVDLTQWWRRADHWWWVTSVDTVVCLETLEHVYDDKAILRALPKGQRVVISVPDFWCEGHCRWFSTVGQVFERYWEILSFSFMVEEPSTNGRHKYFLLRGVRR